MQFKPSSIALAVGLAMTTSVQAQGDAVDAGEVVVSAARTETSTLSIPTPITVVTREQIEASGAATVTDILRGQPGVQVSDLTGDGGNTVVSVRGFAQTANSNVLILVDGRRLNYADTRSPDLSHVALKDVERIEIVQGSAGTLFGDQAVGGVINIITRRPEELRARIEAEYGSYRRHAERLFLSDALDNGLAYRLSAENLFTENYRDNNNRRFKNYSAFVEYAFDSGSVFLDTQHVSDNRELPGALTAADLQTLNRRQNNATFDNDFSDIQNNVVRIGVKRSLTDNWSFEGEYTKRDLNQNLTNSFRGFPSPAGGRIDRDQFSINPRLIGVYDFDNGEALFTLGFDREDGDISSFIPNAFGAVRRSVDQNIRSLYAQAVLPVTQALSLTLGTRHARVDNRLFDATAFANGRQVVDSTTVSEIGLAYQINEQNRVFLRRDGNFRFAKIDELTNSNGVILGTQRGYSLESGYEWQRNNHYLRATAYRLSLDNEIAFDPNVGAFGANVNLDKTLRKGLIFSGGTQLWKQLDLSADLSLIEARFASGTFNGNKISGVAEGIFTVRSNWRFLPKWNLYSDVQFIDDQVAQGDNFNNQAEAPGYAVMNMALRYNAQPWTLQLRVNNVLNKEYEESITNSGGIVPNSGITALQPSPKRNAALTISYDFL